MSINPLNDISKVYLEQVAESAVPGKPAERLGAVTAIPKSEQEAARQRTLAKAAAMRAKKGITKEALDPVGREDKDIDNDGDHDKSDKYLLNRRKVRGAAIAKKKTVKEGFSNWREELSEVAEFISKDKNDQKITEKKVSNKIKINPTIGEAVENLGGTLIEMVEVDELDYIVESVYDELLDEGYEEDDIEEALEFALTEATVTYGHDTNKPHQKKTGAGRLIKAVGRLARQKLASKVSGAKSAARKAVSSGARKVASAATKIADRADSAEKHAKRNTAKGHEEIMRNNREYQTAGKSSGGYRNKGVGRREKVSSGSYTGPTKKAEPVKDPWEGSATTPPKPKAKKAAAKPKATTKTTKTPAKKKKSSKLDNLLSSIRNEEVQIDEKVLSAAETKKKEELVKSMKDKAADFEKRYPGRGKEVMYATATKMAKRMAEQALELQPKSQQQSQPPKEKPLDTAAERQKYANLKMMQQKQQQLEKQRLNLKKQGKLPLEDH